MERRYINCQLHHHKQGCVGTGKPGDGKISAPDKSLVNIIQNNRQCPNSF